jgi:hypothetical protein
MNPIQKPSATFGNPHTSFFAKANTEKTTKQPDNHPKATDAEDVVLLKHKAAKLAEGAVDAYVKVVPEGVDDLNHFLDEVDMAVKNPNKAKHQWLHNAKENPMLKMGFSFGPQIAEAVVPTLPADVRPVVFDFTDWFFTPEALPKHETQKD